jgi:hypothetical protein
VAMPFGGLMTKILKKKLTNIPPNEPKDIPDGAFGKQTVMKSNAQLQRFQEPDEPVPLASSVASSSQSASPSDAVLSMLTQITDRLQSMDTRMIEGFHSMDNQFKCWKLMWNRSRSIYGTLSVI